MNPVSKQRGEHWATKDRRRPEFQNRFALLWCLLTGCCMLVNLALRAGGIVITPEVLIDTYLKGDTIVQTDRLFTGFRLYDKLAIAIAWLGALAIMGLQWRKKRPQSHYLATLLRNLPITVMFFACHWTVSSTWSMELLGIKVSGHSMVYVLASFMHYHNARVAVIDCEEPLLALLLLANIPFMLYCEIWTILAYHATLEICLGLLLALGVTYASYALKLDK